MTIGIIWALCVFTAVNIIITALIVRTRDDRGEVLSYEEIKNMQKAANNIADLNKRLGLQYLPSIRQFTFSGDGLEGINGVVTTKAEVNEIVKRHACREFNLLLDYLGLEVRQSLIKTELVKVGKAKK